MGGRRPPRLGDRQPRHTASPRRRSGSVSFPLVTPLTGPPARARPHRGEAGAPSPAPLRPWWQDSPQLEPRLLAPSSGAAAATAAAGGDSYRRKGEEGGGRGRGRAGRPGAQRPTHTHTQNATHTPAEARAPRPAVGHSLALPESTRFSKWRVPGRGEGSGKAAANQRPRPRRRGEAVAGEGGKEGRLRAQGRVVVAGRGDVRDVRPPARPPVRPAPPAAVTSGPARGGARLREGRCLRRGGGTCEGPPRPAGALWGRASPRPSPPVPPPLPCRASRLTGSVSLRVPEKRRGGGRGADRLRRGRCGQRKKTAVEVGAGEGRVRLSSHPL